ncbi:hypothetical protein AALP_AA7G152200 [Arabis alpina]|uniref:CCHC-type domain-containing protein n=1 Tax=Arabis alpina TaxID=50452 RepID=A0A087GI72_ARAAL|nr:hypothetical protein AALP_AA7G152200 [Arabis alpina]
MRSRRGECSSQVPIQIRRRTTKSEIQHRDGGLKKSRKGKRPKKGGNRFWKNIGLGFKTPREATDRSADKLPNLFQPISSPGPVTMINTNRVEPRNPSNHDRVKPALRRLTPAELAWRKAEGLCFRCKEKGHSRPQCRHKGCQIMVVLENGEEQEWDGEEDLVDDLNVTTTAGVAALSLNSMVGISLPSTMKLQGSICAPPVIVLIDSGLTIQGRGICRAVELQLQGHTVVDDFLPLELGSADIILGIQFLATLGDMRCNWKLQRLCFTIHDTEVVLQGDLSASCSAVSLKALDGVLTAFEHVFAEPQGIPLTRGREHTIVLSQGASPVSVHLFRYPQIQREEIEKQVAAMLAAGIIKESNSPFSSSVKKKDGSWRFCVDYRALNKATVGDNYPILMIDQLLDELHGSVIFSKLDFCAAYHQIHVKAEDVPKTAFRTHDDLSWFSSMTSWSTVDHWKRINITFYKPGLENKAAYILSRLEAPQLLALSMPISLQLSEIEAAVDQDIDLSKLKQEMLSDPTTHPDFSVVQGAYMDKKCPFIGTVFVRGRILSGTCHSAKMQRTIIVRRDYFHFVKKYQSVILLFSCMKRGTRTSLLTSHLASVSRKETMLSSVSAG